MLIRKLKEEDREAYRKLSRYAFETSNNTYANLIMPGKSRPMDQFYGAFEKDLLVAASGVVPFDVKVRSSVFKMGGIDGVASKPEYRNRGIVREILVKIFQDLYENQFPISILYPFKVAFYEMLGYKLVDEAVLYQFEISDIICKKTNYHMKEVERINDDIRNVYQQATENYDYIGLRTEMQWKRHYKNNYKFICYNGDQPEGYVIIYFPKDNGNWLEDLRQTIVIRELLWLNHTAKQAIFNFLWSHRDQRRYIAGVFPLSENIIDHLKTPRVKARKIIVNSLLRIIDVKSVLIGLKYPVDEFNIVIQIHDKFCSWNNGLFKLTSKNKMINIEFQNSDIGSIDLETDITYFAQLIVGYRTIKELLEFGFISINQEKLELLQKIFPKTNNNFIDDF